MKILIIFFFLSFFFASDMPVLMFWEASAAVAEEVMQLARLRPRMNFIRNDRLRREQFRENKRNKFVRRVFISPRGSSGGPHRR